MPARNEIHIVGSENGITIKNITDNDIAIEIGANILTEAGKQLYRIASVPETPKDYLRATAMAIGEEKSALGLSFRKQKFEEKLRISLISSRPGQSPLSEHLFPTGQAG